MTKKTNNPDDQQLERGLENRHIQLIAIGGAIGTGLFMGSGKTIHAAGPSIVLVYAIIGFMLFFVMRAMGELLLSNTKYKSFIDFSADLLGPWAGFFIGWTYWLCWIVTGVADVIAIAGVSIPLTPQDPHSYTQFWWPWLNPWVAVIACVALFYVLNIVAVKLFGELEFWFAIIKIIAILALIAVGAYMIATGFTSPNGTVTSLSNVWNGGNIFPNGVMGFFAGFQIAVFAFVGIELAGTAAAEVKHPERTLPRAINSIPIRVIFFYVLSLIVIMAVTPWNMVDPGSSPFVAMFVLIGIPVAAGIVNFVVLTSAASSANSGVFSTSRMVYGLAEKDGAPKALGKLSKKHVPANGLLFSCICILLGYAILSLMPTIMEAFTVVTTISAILFMFVWTIILISYVVYREKRPEQHERSIYKMPGGVAMCYVVMAFFVFILTLLSLEADTRIALIYTPLWFVLLAVCFFAFARKTYHQK
ncbi:D-serine/D-alanine/glycine transporter (plasmid) [Bartonella sp. HY329]|uniref:D-serine/D-alanine/glycine transporter n=1 Tax=unclassified Bartonella TaxID=2645622 RepID=UPI0021C61393|nr:MULTISPECIES: D-serine/D-alanine/glycine transporter [unclassified Bartonella]UXM96572.1 D-serine/D-alanine/glycine transporter [Bartonella sp. HY329]UXN10895.1 D-serine/D-alanine/glycine transporter [Bartonella sp. HY328]